MILRLVAAALRSPFIVILAALALIGGGLGAFSRLDVEAYPNPVPPLVELITQPDGWSAEEVERYVTIPLEIGLAGMPGLEHTRTQSLFGLSDVKCYFNWNISYKDARQEVINRLQFTPLPNGLQAQISPWNAIGEIFRYNIKGKDYSLTELKTAQDWTMERQFKQVQGVIDVVSFGGMTKQYHVDVDPYRMRGHNLALGQVMSALSNANQNVGGQRLIVGEQSFNVRGIGLLKGTNDIGNVVIQEQRGVPVRVRDVADVSISASPRLGIVGRDGEEDVVQGTVLMRYGGQALPTLEGVYKRIEEIEKNHLLPPGMTIEPYYDRGALVKVTTHTVIENLVVGMVLVTFILTLFLGHIRAALITALNIPISLLIAFIGMVLSGTSANLISLGAVDFGIVVDSTVIMMENIFSHLGPHGRGTMADRISAAAKEVGGPMTFSTIIIGVAFLPLFTMAGVSGVIFSPMARTYSLAIGGAIVMALTLTPVLASKLMSADEEEKESFVMRVLSKVYAPGFKFALARPRTALMIGALPVLASAAAFPFLGGEFMPKLEEGNFWIRATLPTSISLQQSAKYVGRMRDILRGCPRDMKEPCTEQNRKNVEVQTVVSQLGRPDDGTDLAGFYNVELFAPLSPKEKWRKGVTKESLTEELSKQMEEEFPGVIFNFSQMISDNVEEAVSGVKGENSVRVIGPDLKTNEAKAEQIVDLMQNIPGVKDLGLFRSLGQPNVKIQIDRAQCARYGLNSGDVSAVIQAAIGGQTVTQVYENDRHFDLAVRWQESYRGSVDAIREIPVVTPSGSQIPIGQLAKVTREDGPSVIYRDDGQRYAPVKFSVRGRDLKSTVEEARTKIKEKIQLPYDTHLEWAGQMNEMADAMKRLAIIIPITLIIIGLLVYSAVKTWLDTLIVGASIPVACAGGILAIVVAQINFSVSAAMGFISIFGIAVQDSIIVVTYFQRLREDGLGIRQAAQESADKRLRPALMTTLVAMLGLLPAALSTGIGSETQKPLAVVVIGGSLMLAGWSAFLKPAMLLLAHSWLEKRRPPPPVPSFPPGMSMMPPPGHIPPDLSGMAPDEHLVSWWAFVRM
jgi:cobalt-zinc-cadmium resistance protein CzcA